MSEAEAHGARVTVPATSLGAPRRRTSAELLGLALGLASCVVLAFALWRVGTSSLTTTCESGGPTGGGTACRPASSYYERNSLHALLWMSFPVAVALVATANPIKRLRTDGRAAASLVMLIFGLLVAFTNAALPLLIAAVLMAASATAAHASAARQPRGTVQR